MFIDRALLVLPLLLVGAVATAEGYEQDAAAMDGWTLASVQGRGQIHLLRSAEERAGCPAATPACTRPAYLLAGDPIVVVGHAGGFVSAHFGSAKGSSTEGWLPAAAVAATPLPAVTPAAWRGSWVREEASIDIKPAAQPGRIAVAGEATYGMRDPDRVKRGAVNMGEFAGNITPNGARARYAAGGGDYDCRVSMRLMGPYLAVTDNMMCGGANVSFTGLYRHAK